METSLRGKLYFSQNYSLPTKIPKYKTFFSCTGAQCLVAWKNVCKPKKLGGLGLKNLHVQNNCLLMKFAVQALLPDQTPWQDWIDLQHPNALIAPQNSHSFLCQTINHQLPALHTISFVITKSGTNTYFWLDIWLHRQSLATLFPCLYSHTTTPPRSCGCCYEPRSRINPKEPPNI